MSSNLKDQKETPTCTAEKLLRSRVTENSQSPRGRVLPHFPRPAPPERSSGEERPRRSWEGGTPTHLSGPGGAKAPLPSEVLGRHGTPTYAPCKPRAKGCKMNELPHGTSLTGQGRSTGVLTCGDAEGLLGVCSYARLPGLQDESQQQKLRLHRAPHLPPLQGRGGLRHPHRPAPANFSRERGTVGPRRGDDCGRERAAKCAQRTCGRSQAPGATYRLPEGEATGRAAPRRLAAR